MNGPAERIAVLSSTKDPAVDRHFVHLNKFRVDRMRGTIERVRRAIEAGHCQTAETGGAIQGPWLLLPFAFA